MNTNTHAVQQQRNGKQTKPTQVITKHELMQHTRPGSKQAHRETDGNECDRRHWKIVVRHQQQQNAEAIRLN